MKNNKLQAKDFITIGIFTALLFVVEFACGMLGFIHPYIVASYVVMIPLVGAIPMMLFYTKIEKFGMLSIMSVLLAIIMRELFPGGRHGGFVPAGAFGRRLFGGVLRQSVPRHQLQDDRDPFDPLLRVWLYRCLSGQGCGKETL